MFEYFPILYQFKHTDTLHIHACMLHIICNAKRIGVEVSLAHCVFDLSGVVSIDTKLRETSLLSRSISRVILEWRCLYVQTRLSLRASYLQVNIYISAYAYTGSSPRSREYGIPFVSNVAFPCLYIRKNRSTKIDNSTSRGIEMYRNWKIERWRDVLLVYEQKSAVRYSSSIGLNSIGKKWPALGKPLFVANF